jgi:hypothetical protein
VANITNASAEWQSVTLSVDEIWQCREGAVDLDTEAGNQLGLRLRQDDAVRFSAGKTVYYRLSAGRRAVISRISASATVMVASVGLVAAGDIYFN